MHFGKAIKLAFADIQEKANQIRDCKKNLTSHYKLESYAAGTHDHDASLFIE